MATLYIVRHGQCECNVPGLLQGQLESALTELGKRQIEEAGRRLAGVRLTAVYASDLERTRLTGEAIARHHGLSIIAIPQLRECHLGEAQGLTEPQFRRQFPDAWRLWQDDPVRHRPPGGERFATVIERCGCFLKMVRGEYPNSSIAAAVHAGTVAGLICAALGLPEERYLSFQADNASLTVLELGDRPVLRLLNDTCHLPQQ